MNEKLVDAFRTAVAACNPTRRVAEAIARHVDDDVLRPKEGGVVLGIAIGKAAHAMAEGAVVERGIAVSNADHGEVSHWRTMVASHPHPDERSVEAAREVRALVDSAKPNDVVLALISGGSSALVEDSLDHVDTIRALMDAGAPIDDLNAVRIALSSFKGGKLVDRCAAHVVTLVASDVIGDRLDLIGSGPTIGPWFEGVPSAASRRARAKAILERYGLPPEVPHRDEPPPRPDDRVELVLPLRAFADALHGIVGLPLIEEPYVGQVERVAEQLVAHGPCIAYGEPTLHVPHDAGCGGRAQQLALELAKRFRGTSRTAFVAGSDGIDGPPPAGREAPAGAFVDGTTWDAIGAAGIDPQQALDRRDSGTALAAVGALVVTGPTGVNHADIAILD